jgi:hypothetical protein
MERHIFKSAKPHTCAQPIIEGRDLSGQLAIVNIRTHPFLNLRTICRVLALVKVRPSQHGGDAQTLAFGSLRCECEVEISCTCRFSSHTAAAVADSRRTSLFHSLTARQCNHCLKILDSLPTLISICDRLMSKYCCATA